MTHSDDLCDSKYCIMNEPESNEVQPFSLSVRWQRILVLGATVSYLLWLFHSYAVRGFLDTYQRILPKIL